MVEEAAVLGAVLGVVLGAVRGAVWGAVREAREARGAVRVTPILLYTRVD